MLFDAPFAHKRHSTLRVPPPVPATRWRKPVDFPNLAAATAIAVDTETYDPDLLTKGPGWARGRGHVIGVSIAAKAPGVANGKWYFPVRHQLEPHDNLDPANVFGWLAHVLGDSRPKVGANLIYDLGWLDHEGVTVNGKLHDVQFAEALLDEQGRTALDHLAAKYLRSSKTTDALYGWLKEAYGGAANASQRANLYRAPPALVGPYAEDDADLPLLIIEKQWPLLASEGLIPLFELENRLIRLLLKMRKQGVRIDVPYAESLYVQLGRDIGRLTTELHAMTGVHANVNSAASLQKVFDSVGIKYNKTPSGQASFTKEFMTALDHPVAAMVNNIREHNKLRDTFVKSYLLESNVNDIIHCQFHNLRDESGGTKTGRFSSSDPNLQNIPVRSKLGKQVRKAFIPHAGHKHFRKFDYSQIEYRMLAHFAVDGKNPNIARVLDFWNYRLAEWGGDASADTLRSTYVNDPSTDYHVVVQQNVQQVTGMLIDRKPIKNINFGLLYGQTEKALALKAGFTSEQAKGIFTAYHKGAPYVKPTMAAIAEEVQRFGYVRTITNRRTRFELFEPGGWGERGTPLPLQAALARYGQNIVRAYAYRGVNYKFQGSAADVIKIAMDAAHSAGVFDVIGVPLLQVHDELDFSVIDDTPAQNEAYQHLVHLLENAIRLRIPIKVDCGDGLNWGEID
jgi:DNA polymerase-1